MSGTLHDVYEIAVVERPGGDASAVRAWSELVSEANRAARPIGRGRPRLLVTRWSVESDGEPARFPALDGLQSAVPRIIALPDDLCADPWSENRLLSFEAWLRSHYDGGTTLAAANAATRLLERCGLYEHAATRPRWERDGVCVEDCGGLLTAQGERAWLLIGLSIIGRVQGTQAMEALALRAKLPPSSLISAGLYHFSPDLSHGDSNIVRAQRWLYENQAIGVDLKALSRISGLQTRTLQRRFFSATGSRPIEYMQKVRVSHAQGLILQGIRAADVGMRVGYADASAFRRIFMRISGCTPTAYLQRALRNKPAHVTGNAEQCTPALTGTTLD
jgi:AraC-like DNA-binding protein